MSMTTFFITAAIPAGLEREFLQRIHDFDTAHAGCHFQIAANVPDDDLAAMRQINPGFRHFHILKTQP